MNQKLRLTALALSLGMVVAAPASFAEPPAYTYTVEFFGKGTLDAPHDGTAEVKAAYDEGYLMNVYITTATTRNAYASESNGVTNLLFKGLDLQNPAGKKRTIILAAGTYDLAPVRKEQVTFEDSTLSGWNIEVETLLMQNKDKAQLAESGHLQSISFLNSTFEGDVVHTKNTALINNKDYSHLDKNDLKLSLENSTWKGAVRSASSNDVHDTSVSLKNSSSWMVTGKSEVTTLKLEGGSTVEVMPPKESASDGNVAKAAFDEVDGLRAAAYARAEAAPEATPFLHIAKLESMDAKSKFLLNEGSTLAIDESDSDKHTFEFKSVTDVSVKVGEMKEGASTTVVADGKLNDGTQSVTEIVNKMASSVTVDGEKLDKVDYAVGEGVWTNGLTGTANRTESGELVVTPGAETVNANASIVAETTGISLMQWRTEMNDMNKRMGDLRGQKGTAGAWARTYFGRSEYGAQQTETEFQAIQVGADHLISTGDAQVWAGAAFSYTKGDSDFSRGTGETNTYALTAYASTLFDCGSFLDASLKYGRLENEFNISFWENQRLKGDFKTNAWSATLEAGHRFEAAQGFFVEPQLEMMYSRIEGDSYGAGLGTKIDQKDVDMLVGRAGLMAGLKLPAEKGNLYVHASLLHDFDGEAQTVFYRNGKRENDFRQDFGGTWYAYGFGANVFMTESLRLYGEFERTASGIVKTPYRWNVGARYVW
mgnify:FL=1